MDSKPQQTGTRLLIGYGEVATTSGSTSFAMPMKTKPSSRIPLKDEQAGASPVMGANINPRVVEQKTLWF